MDQQTKSCKKDFPKQFRTETAQNDKGYPLYRRRDNGRTVTKRNRGRVVELDNRWVVPYNPYLVELFDCHINVEICSSVQTVKYIHKYVYKGCDRASVKIVNGEEVIDEIDDFVDGRYISPVDACWRIFGFNMHGQSHTIVRLPVHLEDEQTVYFTEGQDLTNRVAPASRLTAYFDECARDEHARELTYIEFPLHYCWHQPSKTWKRRVLHRSNTLARMYSVSVREGERFYLRLLLSHVAGPTSFEDLRTFDGTTYGTFKEACIARGMLEDDSLWVSTIAEVAMHASPKQLRQLFVSVLTLAHPSNPASLWEQFYSQLSEDFSYEWPDDAERSFAHTAHAIDTMLRLEGTYWDAIPGLPPFPQGVVVSDGIEHPNPLIQDELNSSMNQSDGEVDIRHFNDGQSNAFQTIMNAILSPDASHSNVFFLQGFGGTGKTFFNSSLCLHVRSSGKIALAVASSGIASLLLPGGRTAHSRFKIPLQINDSSTCNIAVNSQLAELITHASFILWDEAPMMHRHAFEALDRTLKDICNNVRPMGGKVCVFSGDWRQILPVVICGTRGATVNASLTRSPLWSQVRLLNLYENMRLHPDEIDFSEWLLQVGDGTHENYPVLEIPEDMRIENSSLEGLIEAIYPNLQQHLSNPDFLKDRVILATTNRVVDEINHIIATKLPSFGLASRTYYSVDSVRSDDGAQDTSVLYPIEFLNSLAINGLPPHKLQLSVGCIVVLLRNLNKSGGLCNGTRLIVRRLYDNTIDAEIATGDQVGERVFIPRVRLTPSASTLPFDLSRLQFPVKLAFAMTVNKSQGQTFNRVGLSLLDPVFTHGQLYVACSRVRRRQQLSVLLPPGKTSTTNKVFREAFLS
jgi:hypothetical protein